MSKCPNTGKPIKGYWKISFKNKDYLVKTCSKTCTKIIQESLDKDDGYYEIFGKNLEKMESFQQKLLGVDELNKTRGVEIKDPELKAKKEEMKNKKSGKKSNKSNKSSKKKPNKSSNSNKNKSNKNKSNKANKKK